MPPTKEKLDWAGEGSWLMRRGWWGEDLLVGFQKFFEGGNALEEVGEAVEGGYGAEPGAVVYGGVAADDGARSNVVRDASLSGGYSSIADGEMAGDADLAGENHIFPDRCGAAESGLRAQQRVLSDCRSVAHLDEVVDFDAGGDSRFAYRGAIDAGVGLDFDGVAEDCGAGLNDLGPAAVRALGKAEAVGADDGAILEHDVVAELAAFAHDSVGVGEEAVADADTVVENNVGEEDGVVADVAVLADDDIGADVRAEADAGGVADDGGAMNARRVGGCGVEVLDGTGPREVGIGGAEGGCLGGGEAGLDDEGGGASGAGLRGVLGVGNKGEVSGAGGFDAGNSFDRELGCGFEGLALACNQFGFQMLG